MCHISTQSLSVICFQSISLAVEQINQKEKKINEKLKFSSSSAMVEVERMSEGNFSSSPLTDSLTRSLLLGV
jgi:hypothetical protein